MANNQTQIRRYDNAKDKTDTKKMKKGSDYSKIINNTYLFNTTTTITTTAVLSSVYSANHPV